MTDTLRGECSEWFRNELGLEPDEEDLLAVIAFARAHQAAGLREAAKECQRRQINCILITGQAKDREFKPGELIGWRANEQLLDSLAKDLEAQATARERGA